MKKLTTIICLLTITSFFANAQSGYFLGGDFSMFSNKNEYPMGKDIVSGFTFSPMIGKMITEDIGAGVMLEYGNQSSENSTFNNQTRVVKGNSQTFGAGLFARKYFSINDMFKPVLHLSSSYSSTSGEDKLTVDGVSTTTNSPDIKDFKVGIRPSIAIFLNSEWSVEFNFGGLWYNSSSSTNNQGVKTKNNYFNLNANSPSFGYSIIYYFGG